MRVKYYYCVGTAIVVMTVVLTHLPFSSSQVLRDSVEEYHADVYFREGLQFLTSNSLQEAEKAFKQAIYYQPNYAPHHYYLAEVYLQEGFFNQAKQEYKKTLDLDQESYSASYRLGLLHAQLSEYTEAISLIKRSITLNPYNIESYHRLAQIYIEIGDYKSAEETYNLLRRVEHLEK